MKTYLLILLLSGYACTSFAQYYLRGELKDESGNGLQGVRIALASKGNYPFYTGAGGAFGIPTSLKVDTITFMQEGYDTLKTAVITNQFGNFSIKAQAKKLSWS